MAPRRWSLREDATTARSRPEYLCTPRITAAQQEKRTAERELAAYSATTDLLPLELDLANREVSLAEKRIAAWRQAVEERRAVEVQRQAEVARLEAATTTGPLQALAVRSAEMASLTMPSSILRAPSTPFLSQAAT